MFKKNFRVLITLAFVGAATLATALFTTKDLSTKTKDSTSCPTSLHSKKSTIAPSELARAAYIDENIKQIALANNSFGIDLYHTLIKNEETKNICFSPYSLAAALGMTRVGADNKTKTEIDTVLHINGLDTIYHPTSKQLQNTLLENDTAIDLSLAIANKLFIQNNFPLLSPFTNTLNDYYDANFASVDFGEQPMASDLINSWIQKASQDMIPTLVTPRDFTPLTKLVLANAIYFKGMWQKPFAKDTTHEAPFFVNETSIVDTPMMQQTNSFPYMETSDFQLLELNYKATDENAEETNPFSMIVLLPKTSDGLSEIEKLVTHELLQNCLSQMQTKKIIVKLPLFSFDVSSNVQEALQQLGMIHAFDVDKADFSKMTQAAHLHISKVLHKAVIEVAEEGTKAAAATAVITNMRSTANFKTPFPLIFNADHPFLFFIRHKTTNTILFMGRLVQPK